MSKYSLAKETILGLNERATPLSIEPKDAQEALLISLVQSLRDAQGPEYVRGILQYEVDNLGSAGLFDIQRGGGHS